MIERDEELQELLRRWESPAPGPGLDTRVSNTIRKPRTRRWLPIAAGILLAAGVAKLLLPGTGPDPRGFRPLANGAITVEKAGGAQ